MFYLQSGHTLSFQRDPGFKDLSQTFVLMKAHGLHLLFWIFQILRLVSTLALKSNLQEKKAGNLSETNGKDICSCKYFRCVFHFSLLYSDRTPECCCFIVLKLTTLYTRLLFILMNEIKL